MKHLLTRMMVIGMVTASLASCGGLAKSRQECSTFMFSNESNKNISFTLTYKPSRTTFMDLFAKPSSTTSYISYTDTFLHAYDVYGEVRALNVTFKDPPATVANKDVSLARGGVNACLYKAAIDKDRLVLAPVK